MPTQYDALAYGDDSDEDVSMEQENTTDIAPFEDLSTARTDETTVLEVIYGDDFSIENNGRASILFIRVRPPDLEPQRVGSSSDDDSEWSETTPTDGRLN
mmetsp:Transcript_23251/g.27488  ORF Transcript_23251/g.27488 Transcript_23251/m.27488 type:complete len:100 (+) Transcript_23251:172-471(+)